MGMADNCREMIRNDLESFQLLNQPIREWLGMSKVFDKIEVASEVYHGQPEGLIEIHDCCIADYKSPLGKDFVMKVTAPSCDDVAASLNRIDRSGVKIVGFHAHAKPAGGTSTDGTAKPATGAQGDLEDYAAQQEARIKEIETQIAALEPDAETLAAYEERGAMFEHPWYMDKDFPLSDAEAEHMGAYAWTANMDADRNPFSHADAPEPHTAWALGWHKMSVLRAELVTAIDAVVEPPAPEASGEAFAICEGGTILIGPGVEHILVPFSDKARATATIDLAAKRDGSVLMAVSHEIESLGAVESVLSVESRCYPCRLDAMVAAHGVLVEAVNQLPQTAKGVPTKRAEAAFIDLDDWLNIEIAAMDAEPESAGGEDDDDAQGDAYGESDAPTEAEPAEVF